MARSNRTFYFFICASCIVHGMLWFAQEELPVSIPLHKNETTGNSIKISFINPIETGESMIDKEEEPIVSKKNRLPVQWSRQHPAQLNKKNKRLLVVSQEQLAPQSLQDSNLVLNTITQNIEQGITREINSQNKRPDNFQESTRKNIRAIAVENKEKSLTSQQLTRIKSSLNSSFERYFNYPRLAQKNGWQGTVKLGLRIESNGQLSKIHLVSTSGFPLLDKAALESLQKISTLEDVDLWLNGLHLDTVLPVQYKLVDS